MFKTVTFSLPILNRAWVIASGERILPTRAAAANLASLLRLRTGAFSLA